MERVVIVGADDASRRIWEALVQSGGAEVIGFVEPDSRRHGRAFLGQTIQPLQWLTSVAFDAIAAPDGGDDAIGPQLAAIGIAADRMFWCPSGEDDAALMTRAAERFPDPLVALLASHAACAATRVGIFGTGAGGMKVWEALADLDSAAVTWFADNDPKRQGRKLLWADVIAPAEIAARNFDVVVIGSMSRDPIRAQLLSLGIPAGSILMPNVTGTVEDIRTELESALGALEQVTQ